MATGKLIGTDAVGSQTGGQANAVSTCRWQATGTGKVQKIRFYAATSSHVKVGIYTGTDYATTRIAVQNTSTAVTGGQWNDINLEAEVDVTKDTYYWIAILLSEQATIRYDTEAGRPEKRRDRTYTDGLPASFDSSWTDGSGIYLSVAGYGILVLSPSGISQPLSYGSPKLNFTLNPSGISQALDYGTPLVEQAGAFIYPTGIEQVVALGTPEVIKLLQFIYPTGIDQPPVIGTPALIYPQTLAPQGIAQAIALGTPSVAIYGIIRPDGITQLVAIGSPSLYKYVWHVILDGQYATETPEKNRLFVTGRDDYGNPVWGEAQDSTEIGLVGERLDLQQELAVPTTAQVSSMASAILSKMRLTGKRGVILIPPNCGQELFDVVQISDSGANQQAVSFRVVGIRFEYSPKQARYQHRLILGAP
jgi:hypothetical protein